MNDLSRALKVYTDQAREGFDLAEESAQANDVNHVAEVLATIGASLTKASETLKGLSSYAR